ncbi:Uncharacterised protein [Acinetobacter baumannii]|nr:Uncharacterised protein [Acinetobacter baumannii]
MPIAHHVDDKGVKTVNRQRMTGKYAQPADRLRQTVFHPHQQRHRRHKHQRAAVDVIGISEVAVDKQLMFGAARDQRHAQRKSQRRQPAHGAPARLHHANRPSGQRIQQVVEGIAVDIQVNRQQMRVAEGQLIGIRVGDRRQHHQRGGQVAARYRFDADQRRQQVNHRDGVEKPQMIEHRLLQDAAQRRPETDLGESRDIDQRNGAVEQNAAEDAGEMPPAGALFAEEQVAGNHEEQRHRHARQ